MDGTRAIESVCEVYPDLRERVALDDSKRQVEAYVEGALVLVPEVAVAVLVC